MVESKLDVSIGRLAKTVENFNGRKVLVVGDLIVDRYIFGDISEISHEAPVPVVDYIREEFRPGGAANLISNVISLGGKALAAGIVGRDNYGSWLREALDKRGVDISGIVVDQSRPTNQKTRIMVKQHQIVRIDRDTHTEAEAPIADKILDYAKNAMKDVDCVVISDYDNGVVTPKLVDSLVHFARKNGKKIVADPGIRHCLDFVGVNFVKSNMTDVSRATDISVINETSLINLGFHLLNRLKCESVLINCGEKGVVLFHKNNITRIPPPISTTNFFDVTGLRDVTTATIALSLSTGASSIEAAVLANVGAGVKGGKIGTAVINAEEICDHLRLHNEILSQITQLTVM